MVSMGTLRLLMGIGHGLDGLGGPHGGLDGQSLGGLDSLDGLGGLDSLDGLECLGGLNSLGGLDSLRGLDSLGGLHGDG